MRGAIESASCDNSGQAATSGLETWGSPRISPATTAGGSLIKASKMHVGRFFYENGLDFSAVESPSFRHMISHFSGRGMMYQTPTVEELKGWIFEEVMKEMNERVEEIRRSWGETGCSILLDGWTDANGRSLVNVLADCPKGTVYLRSSDISDCVGNVDAMLTFFVEVLAEVGIENVVQIIADSSSALMKEVGRQLMERYRPLFWTVSASHCIELMLEKFRGMDLINETLQKAEIITSFLCSHPIGRDLVDSSKISSIRPFITLENIVLKKESLKAMFSSSPSQTSTMEGRRVAEVVADRAFWIGASIILQGVIPLARVIEWMNESSKEHMGNIYETIDQAKETIKEGFKKKSDYSPFWKVVDEVWNEALYSPLHSAGYYLNPKLFYSDDFFIDPEVVTGLYCCFVRSAADLCVQDRLTVQMELYRTAKGAMAAGVAEDRRSSVSPAIWWARYGGECPELQRLAVRILSQTCDGAARFRLDRGLAETLLINGRSEEEQKRLKDMVFLRYNMQLQSFVPGNTSNVAPDPVEGRAGKRSGNGVSQNGDASTDAGDGRR